ncbi:hypothetical protein GALL_57300 [mine drainage metagenome]|uniref:Uncharacterized protein n=1 Tax=mine drainage metagenome TaxID=410659 RepID=A0A1J5SW11_9ZZZZ
MKVTKKNICETIDTIQGEYSLLFDNLILLKNFKSQKFNAQMIFEFQYKLGCSLFQLASIRNQIILEEKKLIAKKGKVEIKWFISKMQLFKKFKNGIDNCITIGKSLGDAFVWHFYQFNLPELFKNLEHEEIKIFPIGAGGIGELKFIQKYFAFNNHFVILHGISNLLRIGDISFISMKDFRLTSIGEIKTKKMGNNKVNISITAIDAIGRNFLQEQNLPDIQVTENNFYKDYFDPERFKRQIEKTKKYLSSNIRNENDENKIFYDNYHVQEFEEAIALLKNKPFNIKKVSSSLLYVTFKTSSKKISKRMFIKEDANILKKHEKEIENDIISIYDEAIPNYPIRFGSIHYDKNLSTNILIGASPLFWYPIKPEILKEIYFQNIFCLTLFNPTKLYSSLNTMGINFMKDESTGKYFLGKKLDIGIMRLEYFNYFLILIENLLHTQDAVISIINEVVSLAESKKMEFPNAKMQTEILHLFTHYNKDKID